MNSKSLIKIITEIFCYLIFINVSIAAPVQEMNTLYEIKEKIITEDPIVFSTVGNGVIIYSMWGDEGNDEVLHKYQELNKFIAENVNLGTITGSKECVYGVTVNQ